ncbi:2-keto-3-deoxy-L-rhamnonate aldolase RhmA [Sphingomonas sp. PvP055]
MKRIRSALFTPASNARAIEKARGLDCDAVILDLEDAVAPDSKADARAQAIAAARVGGFGDRLLVLRVNALDTDWGEADLEAARGAGFDAVLLPKVSHPDDLALARATLGDVRVWAMIETCAAMLALPAIAAAPGLGCLIAGTNDLAKEMRCTPGADRMPLLPHLVGIVTAARAHGLMALDGVSNVLGGYARAGGGMCAGCGVRVRRKDAGSPGTDRPGQPRFRAIGGAGALGRGGDRGVRLAGECAAGRYPRERRDDRAVASGASRANRG